MISLRQPGPAEIRAFLARQKDQPFSYPEVGASRGEAPQGYDVDHNRIRLGAGAAAWEAACAAIQSWRMARLGWVELQALDGSLAPGLEVAMLVHRFGLWWLNAARVVYTVDEDSPIVGAGWALFERAGIAPLRFAAIVVLLTAVHFHYAGFALPLLTGLAARALRGGAAQAACLGVVLGVPLVAVGITASQLGSGPLLEALAAWITALAGLLTAWLHLRLAFRPYGAPLVHALWAITGLALAAGMVLAALYGSRAYLFIPWLDYPRMWAVHGSANGLGFAFCGLLAWNLADRRS
jgi:hypothetical protein